MSKKTRITICKRTLCVILTVAMLLSILPTSALALDPTEKPNEIEFKAMTLDNEAGGRVSEYQYVTTLNTFYNEINMSNEDGTDNGYSWALLSYTLEKGQPVDLKLYRMSDDTPFTYGDSIELAHSSSAVPDEPFLGEFVGYLHGIPLLDESGQPFSGDIPEDVHDQLVWNAVFGNLAAETMRSYPAVGFKGEVLDIPAPALQDDEPEDEPFVDGPVDWPDDDEEDDTVLPDELLDTDESPVPDEQPDEAGGEIVDQPDADASQPTADEDHPEMDEAPSDGSTDEQGAGLVDEQSVITEEQSASDDLNDQPAEPESNAEDQAGDQLAPLPVDADEPSANLPEGAVDSPSGLADDVEEPPVDLTDDVEEPSVDLTDVPFTSELENQFSDKAEPSDPADEMMEQPEETPDMDIPHYTEADVLIDRSSVNTFSLFNSAADEASGEKQYRNYFLWNGLIETEDGAIGFPGLESGNYVIVMQPTTPGAEQYRSFLAFTQNSELQDRFTDSDAWHELVQVYGEDPVNMLTGSFSWSYRDLALYGKHDLEFNRYYESTSADRDHHLGLGWSSDFTGELDVQNLFIRASLPGGKEFYFNLKFDGTFRSVGDYTLEWMGSEYHLTNQYDKTVYVFSKEGQLQNISYLNGNVVEMEYSGDKLTRISNDSGSFQLDYSGEHISQITDSEGRNVTLEYDGDYLARVLNPDGDSLVYTYDENGYLSKVENLKGEVYVENTYDGEGRVIHQYAVNMGTFDFTYNLGARENTSTGTDGYLLSIRYDELGRIVEKTDAAGTEYYEYNDLNQRVSQTDKEGNTYRYEHDEEGNISAILYPDGTSERYGYDENRKVTEFTDRNGSMSSYTYNDKGEVLSATDGRGGTASFQYDDKGNMTSMTDTEGVVTTYTYDSAGNRTSATDGNGNTTTFTYDGQGRLVKQTDAEGGVTTYEYTQAGKLVKTVDALGNVQTHTVDGNGFDTSESDWMGNVTLFERNTQNQITKVTNPLGASTIYSYDERGNMTAATDANGNQTSYTYDASGRVVSMTTPQGNTWYYGYDKDGRQTSVTDPAGGVSSTVYNEVGRITSDSDPRGAVTTYSYDGVGNITNIVDALGHDTVMVYDENGNLTAQTDRNGDTTTFVYDKENRLVSTTDALGQTTRYTYDANGNQTSIKSAEGFETGCVFDALNRPVSVTDALSRVTSQTYDALGRVTSATYADGASVSYTYDANGQVLTATDELGGVVSYTYDVNGQMLTMTDPMGGVTGYTYDDVGNVTTTTTPMGFVTSYTYDAANKVSTVTDAENYTVSYTYDSMDRINTVTDAEGGVTSYSYDAAGNVETITDAEGGVVRYQYDLLGRMTAQTDARGNTWTFAYDNEGRTTLSTDALDHSSSKRYDAIGQLVSETDRNGNTWTYTYDKDGRMTTKTDPLGAVTAYVYDSVGNLLSTTTQLGRVDRYTYDARDRMTSATDPLGHTVTFYYDDLGRLVGMDNKDGTHVSWTYDANGNNLTVVDEEGYTVSYVYDADGRMTKLTNARGYSTAYEYDKVGNVTAVTDALDGVTRAVYDGNGNLLTQTDVLGHTTSYTYDKLGRATSITDPNGGVTCAVYDANGNITQITDAEGYVTTYTYDALDRLVGYVDADGYTWSIAYDPNGNIISETDGRGNTTHYVYDGLDRMVGKTDAEGGVSSRTFDEDGRLLQTVNEEGAVTKYIYDADSRVVEMIDALGNSTKYTYDEMDRVTSVTDARGGVTNYVYTDRGDVASVTDAEGYTVSYQYDGNHNLVKMTTVDGDTTYEYDPLDRRIATTTPDGLTERLEYDGMGRVTAAIDKGGHKTQYLYDAKGNVVQTIDALGNVAAYEYDLMDNLTKVTLHRVDTQDKVDEYQVTLYEYNGRRLTTKVVDMLGNVTVNEYDENGNLSKVIDADGFVTEYTYNALDMVSHISYNGGKQADYQYNAVGSLVKMEDWTGTNTFELDLLERITKATDHKGHVTTYTYDSVGNQTVVGYPDGTAATKEYDLVHNLTSVTEADGRTTAYQYDGMRRTTHMDYPDGWQEDYTYDAIGQILAIDDTDPTKKDMKQQKNRFEYDACGNMVYEYMRGNGTGEATVESRYTYDELHRIVHAQETYGSHSRTYIYDSLGNLTWETNDTNETTDYKINSLNQIAVKSSDEFKTQTAFTYDGRGNLIFEEYGKNKKLARVAEYTYDETNRMVLGVNANGESSTYLFNGLGALVEQTWIIAKNGYGYHDVSAEAAQAEAPAEPQVETLAPDAAELLAPAGVEEAAALAVPGLVVMVNNGQSHGQGNGSSNNDKPTGTDVKKTSTVVKDFVVDYTSATRDPLMEYEVNGLDYRYVYGNERLSVNVTGIENGSGHIVENGNQIRLYYHTDLRGTFDYLTSPVSQKVESWTHYNEWGEITHNAVLKCGQRELDLVKNYTGHDFDSVLSQYYAKARMYDAGDRRFTSVDPVLNPVKFDLKQYTITPVQFHEYLYTENAPLTNVDPTGFITITSSDGRKANFYVISSLHLDPSRKELSWYISLDDVMNFLYGGTNTHISKSVANPPMLPPHISANTYNVGGYYFIKLSCLKSELQNRGVKIGDDIKSLVFNPNDYKKETAYKNIDAQIEKIIQTGKFTTRGFTYYYRNHDPRQHTEQRLLTAYLNFVAATSTSSDDAVSAFGDVVNLTGNGIDMVTERLGNFYGVPETQLGLLSLGDLLNIGYSLFKDDWYESAYEANIAAIADYNLVHLDNEIYKFYFHDRQNNAMYSEVRAHFVLELLKLKQTGPYQSCNSSIFEAFASDYKKMFNERIDQVVRINVDPKSDERTEFRTRFEQKVADLKDSKDSMKKMMEDNGYSLE